MSSKNVLYILLSLVLILLGYSFVDRIIHVDDGILAEPTYFLLNEGIMRSEAFRGWWQGEEKFVFTHKLFLYTGVIFIALFGWSAAAVKTVSATYTVFLLAAWAGVFRFFKLSRELFLFFALLILANGHIFEFSFVYRPEIAVAFWGTFCIYFLERYLTTFRWPLLALAGLCASLAIGNHLNGVIIPGAGCLLLLYRRHYLPMLAFGCIAATGFLFYLLGIHSVEDFTLMINQFKHAQDLGSRHGTVSHYLLNILNEQRRYLHSPREIGFTLLFASSIWFGRHEIGQNYKNFAIYTLAACFWLALIAHGKTSKYLIIVIPLITFLATVGFQVFWQKHRKTALIFLALFFVGQAPTIYHFTFTKESAPRDYAQLLSHIPKGSAILGPENTVFFGIPGYRVQGFISYQYKAAHKHFFFTPQDLEKSLDLYGIQAVVFDSSNWRRYEMNEHAFSQFRMTQHFKGTTDTYWLFERQPATSTSEVNN